MPDEIRRLIALEAARLMYEEGVKEYRDAKRKAARRFGSVKALHLGSHLPGNAEIHAEVARLIALHEGAALPERVLEMRLAALRVMERLEQFRPYLVGSVLSGVVSSRSDIDLHLFADSPEEVERFLEGSETDFECELVTVHHGDTFMEYPHIYLEEGGYEVECTVYPTGEIRNVPRSSITGKPMERVDARRLKKMLSEMLPGSERSEDDQDTADGGHGP